jgi:hypothetical protein
MLSHIAEIKKREVGRLQRLAEAVEAFIENREQESAAADLREVVQHLQTVVEQIWSHRYGRFSRRSFVSLGSVPPINDRYLLP